MLTKKEFDKIFNKYFGLLNDLYMVTVANVVGNSNKIALSKPYLASRIANSLLEVEQIALTPHLTEECRRVIIEKTLEYFAEFFDQVTQKDRLVAFAKRQIDSPRAPLRIKAKTLLKKWNYI